MKLIRIGGLALLAATVGLGAWAATKAWAVHCGVTGLPSCTENVANTKHNLSGNTDIVPTSATSGTTEVCVFCHTPHGARSNVAGFAPLWNRALPPETGGGFQMYTSPNFDAVGSSGNPRGVSLACLSCHDGTIALDALINAPGSGGFQTGNRDVTGTPVRIGLNFSGDGVDGAGSLKEGNRPNGTGGFQGGLADFVNPGTANGTEPFPNLGRDLLDDHPISMRMPQSSVDPQFTEAIASPVSSTGGIRPIARAGTTLPTDKRDQIRLYRTDNTNIDWVECASCHNPHTPRTTFLRLPSIVGGASDGEVSPAYASGTSGARTLNHEPNQGSLICLTCHQK